MNKQGRLKGCPYLKQRKEAIMPKGREYQYVKKNEFNKLKDQVENLDDEQGEINDLYFLVKRNILETNMQKLDKKFKPKTFKRPR